MPPPSQDAQRPQRGRDGVGVAISWLLPIADSSTDAGRPYGQR